MRNYHKDILVYIGDGKEFVFPSIGSLLLTSNSADTAVKPSSFLDFNAFATGNYPSQISYFSELWDRSEIDINRFFLQLSDKLLSSIQRSDSFSLNDAGQFRLVDNKVFFMSYGVLEEIVDDHNTFTKTVDHQVKNIAPIVSTSSSILEEIEPSENVQEEMTKIEEKKASDHVFISRPLHFRKVAAVLLIFVTAFSGLFVYNNYSDNFSFPTRFNLEDIGYNKNEINKAPVLTDYPENATIVDGKDLGEDLKEANVVISEIDFVANDDSSDSALVESTVSADVDAISTAPITEEDRESCTYILGSFGKQKNITELNQKLTDMGVEPYNDRVGKLTRVGATLPCENEDLLALLRKISPDMWLL